MEKKIAFLGSKPIGYRCLEFLIDNQISLNCKVVAIFSKETTSFGNDLSIKKLAEENKIFYGTSLDELISSDHEIDFIISVQYHLILKPAHIKKAKILAVNLHMAPLPEYRGCNQFSFAIYNDAKNFGTTLHQLEAGIDNGKIIAERRFPIEKNILVKELYDKTFDESIILFKENIENIINEKFTLKPQEEMIPERGMHLYFRKDIDKLKQIDLGTDAKEIAKKVRATAMPGYEPPYTIIEGEKIYLIPEKTYKFF
ncbi:MAG TPA: formyltransferase family protein [Puia sp.]|nr:formyltransferase family protein [Puia sp.]